LGVGRSTFSLILISAQNRLLFRRSLTRWYRQHGRDLPWRQTRDPYAILVSEVMLQQTQVATVLPFYNKWLDRFPNFAVLAHASKNDVLRVWQGLGYYVRARNLHATAKIVQHEHHGRLPSSIEKLRLLPGVGKYTAHAVATFAFHQPVPIVETNTARVSARLFNLRTPIDSAAGCKILWNGARELLPKRGAAHFNSALVDLGALVCLPRKPKCEICPVRKFCRAINPGILPLKKARPRTRRLTENHAYVVRQGKILLERSAGRWRGMWILPPLKRRSQTNGAIHTSIFPFTNHSITLHIFPRPWYQADNRSQCWFAIEALDSIPLPAPHRRAIGSVLSIGC
jgi:A/G-specific adenine glycosylase